MFLLAPTLSTIFKGLFSSCFLDGFIMNSFSIIPTLTQPIGPFHGIFELCKANETVLMHKISGLSCPLYDNKLQTI